MPLWAVETVAVAVTFASGLVLSRVAGFGPVASVAWAYFVGTVATIAVATVQVALMLPTSPLLTWAVLAVVTVVAAWRAHRTGADLRISGRALVVAAALFAAVMVAVYATTPTRAHLDSVNYVSVGAMMARGTFHEVMPNWFFSKRLIGVGIIHAPAWFAREADLPAVTPLLMLSVLGMAAWFVVQQVRPRVGRRAAWGLAALVVVVAMSYNRMVFSALLVNAHVLFAGCLLALAGLAMVAASRRPVAPLVLAAALAVPALVVSRPDGALYAAVAIVPFLLVPETTFRHRAAVFASLGLSMVAIYGYIVIERMQDGVLPDGVANGHLYGGIAVLLALPLLLWSWPRRHGLAMLVAVEGMVWAIALLFAARVPEKTYLSAAATWNNVILARGGWTVTLAVLGLLVVVVTIGWRARETEPLRFVVTSFVPLALLLMAARADPTSGIHGGVYRVGPGDSLNRSLAHVVLVALVFVVVRVVSGRGRGLGLWSAQLAMEPSPSPADDPGVAAGRGGADGYDRIEPDGSGARGRTSAPRRGAGSAGGPATSQWAE